MNLQGKIKSDLFSFPNRHCLCFALPPLTTMYTSYPSLWVYISNGWFEEDGNTVPKLRNQVKLSPSWVYGGKRKANKESLRKEEIEKLHFFSPPISWTTLLLTEKERSVFCPTSRQIYPWNHRQAGRQINRSVSSLQTASFAAAADSTSPPSWVGWEGKLGPGLMWEVVPG